MIDRAAATLAAMADTKWLVEASPMTCPPDEPMFPSHDPRNVHQQQQQHQCDDSALDRWQRGYYDRNAETNSQLGVEYERLISVNTLLDLTPGAEMAVEMTPAGKFDDVVVYYREGRPDEGFYLCQMKHKQPRQANPTNNKHHSDLSIKRLDVFSDNGPYALIVYLDSFCKIIQHRLFYKASAMHFPETLLIKEMTLVTNISFESTLTKYLVPVVPRRYWGSRGPEHRGECWRFDYAKVREDYGTHLPDLEKHLADQASKNNGDAPPVSIAANPRAVIGKFFELLVFEVNVPNVYDMRSVVTDKLRELSKWDLTEQQSERAFELLMDEVSKFFGEKLKEDEMTKKLVPQRQARKATVHDRDRIIKRIIDKLKLTSLKLTTWRRNSF